MLQFCRLFHELREVISHFLEVASAHVEVIMASHNSSPHSSTTMKAVFYEGKPFEMVTKEIPKPKIIQDTDALIRITTAAICGSDLHNYHGVFGSSEVPYSMGHEGMGIVEEIGPGVTTVKVGDRVVIPDFPATGHRQVEPTILAGFAIYGEGKDFGNLGGCQGMMSSSFPSIHVPPFY